MHTPSSNNDTSSPLDDSKPTRIQIKPPSIISQSESIYVFNYTSIYSCPSPDIRIEIIDKKLLDNLKDQCRQSRLNSLSDVRRNDGHFLLNTTSKGHTIYYRCGFPNKDWCQNTSVLKTQDNSIPIRHPSVSLCSNKHIHEPTDLLKVYFSLESLLHPPIKQQHLSIYTWPCSSYASDGLFDLAPNLVLICILILIDGCILFGFNLLFHSLIDEKHQGITELLRLISIRPILNSIAWFLRNFFIQLIINIFLILILKISFDGGIYLPYVSIWLIIPIIILWTIQVLSRAVFIAHLFSSNLKATLWSWLIYFISFWLAWSSSVRLPMILHLIASAWLPFYSIKRLFILLFRINTDLGRWNDLISEIIFIWFSMIIGSLFMWILAYYLEQIRPGKYGIPRPWSWPLDNIRNNRIKNQKRRESVTMQMVEPPSGTNTTVQVNNLTKTYGRLNTEQQLAVDHVSFKLDRSIIYGLIGHNGAGKTSTMEMMCGLLPCDCGTIEIHDKDLYENINELQTCIGYCPQQDMLFSHLTVKEQLEFYARVRSKGKNVDYDQIQELLTMMEMGKCSQQLCHTLSGGMQRKLSILCAFVGQANVILLGKKNKLLIVFVLSISAVEMCGTVTKKIIPHRDRDQNKNFTGTRTETGKKLPGPEPRPEKNYRDHDRDRDQRLNPRLHDGLNSVNFCTSEVTIFEKKSRKVLVVD
jgi:ABC-type Na+ transport system ATPase subunit NatA